MLVPLDHDVIFDLFDFICVESSLHAGFLLMLCGSRMY